MNVPGPGADPMAPELAGPVGTLLRDLIQEKTGFFFESARLNLMAEKIAPRLLVHACRSPLDYYYILKYEEKGPEEWRALIEAFSVQETYFWREFDQVRYLTDHLVPAWFKRTSEPLRIWSAACATGEEPYTLAIALLEAGFGDHPIELIASDASESALAKARTAIYRERSFRALPPELRVKYFSARGESFELDPLIRKRVSFHWANLVRLDDFNTLGVVPVIFCRNVFIYFSPPTITRVVTAFAERMPPQGHLFVGASESLLRITTLFELKVAAGTFAYVRQP